MSYMMRDRPDGQFEIVIKKPVVLSVFPERDMAERFFALLLSEEEELIDDEPASYGKAVRDVSDAQNEAQDEIDAAFAAKPRPAVAKPAMPAIAAPKRAPAIRVEKIELTEAQADAAFKRISSGEKIADVAPDFGLTMGQLRGRWAVHCHHLQQHLAEGGQIACSNCQRKFMPSISQPDTCARCSK